jgi:hypothetical protein
MQELSVIEVLQLKIRQEEEAYEVALKRNCSGSELRQMEERIKQSKSTLEYIQEIYKN